MHYSLRRATLWNLAGYLYLIIASLVSTPILVRSLGLARFGQYSLIVATLILVSAFDLGLPQAVVRALSRDHNYSPSRQALWATSSVLFIATGLVAGLVAMVAAAYLHLENAVLPLIFALGVMTNLVAHYSTLPQAEGHFGYYNSKTFIVGTGNTLLAAALAWSGQGLPAIFSALLLCYLLTLLPLAYFSLKFFPYPRTGHFSLPVARELITFGLKNQIGKLVGQVRAQYPKYLLAAVSPLALSAYVIAQGLVEKAAGSISQLATALYPASARGTGRSIYPLYRRLQLCLAGLGLLSVGVYFLWGFPFLSWWLDNAVLVLQVDAILRVLIWYFAALVLSPLPSVILDGRGRPELTSLFATLTTTLEIALALILFPRYGVLAPAYASLMSILVLTPPLLFVTHRVLTWSPPPKYRTQTSA